MGQDAELIKAYAKLVYKPLSFVYFNYPWGEDGLLKNEDGPDEWQADVLRLLGRQMKASAEGSKESVRLAIRSGHGPGKTALIAWIMDFFMSTRPYLKGVATANTKQQLEDKTWAELSKWHMLSLNAHWFNKTATKFSYALDAEKGQNWFISMVPWSKDRSEAFAGTHAEHVLYVFDEASAIDNVIWEVSEGAMTTPTAVWIVCGNPTKATGQFADCFTKDNKKNGGRWHCFEVDSRRAKKTNKAEIERWAEKYGEDSDFFRVRVLGRPPRSGVMQLIGDALVAEAAGRVIHESVYHREAKILGVDVARSGDDASVIVKRQGLAAFDLETFSIPDTMQLASIVARRIDDWKPNAVFIDVVGIGAGVVDRLRSLGYRVIEVNGSKMAGKAGEYANKRTEMWCAMRDWLDSGGGIPDDRDLKEDLTLPEYGFDNKDRWQLERKVDVKVRLGKSPDAADALALTFAEPVAARLSRREEHFRKQRRFANSDYDVAGYYFNRRKKAG